MARESCLATLGKAVDRGNTLDWDGNTSQVRHKGSRHMECPRVVGFGGPVDH
jgi:hypothetical protein